jgi:hypothetical protein
VFLEWEKVPIAVQQPVAIHQTTCRNDHVDGASYRHATRTKPPVISSRFDGYIFTAKRDLFESSQQAPCPGKASVFLEPAQHFGQDQIAYEKELISKVLV